MVKINKSGIVNAVIVLMLTTLLVACAPSAQTVQTAIAETQVGWTAVPSQTPFPTATPYSSYTPPPTVYVTKIVTPTFTPTAIYTPTVTSDPLVRDKGNGFYLVGSEIAPGLWRSTGKSTTTTCTWTISAMNGDTIDFYFGMAGGTVYIPQEAYQVKFENCGKFIYLSPPE